MTIPDFINHHWIATLDDVQLAKAEAELCAVFHKQEKTAKARMGPRYTLLEGPAPLVNAWQRWSLVSNAARSRGLVKRRA